MSLISNVMFGQLAVLGRIGGNNAVYSGRNALYSGTGNTELQIQQGNFNAKFAGRMEEDSRARTKNLFKKRLSGFETFA